MSILHNETEATILPQQSMQCDEIMGPVESSSLDFEHEDPTEEEEFDDDEFDDEEDEDDDFHYYPVHEEYYDEFIGEYSTRIIMF